MLASHCDLCVKFGDPSGEVIDLVEAELRHVMNGGREVFRPIVPRFQRGARFSTRGTLGRGEPRLTADTRDAIYEAVAAGIGAGFMWRHGTQRTDMVRRLPIIDLSASSEEVAFALADERNQMVDLFLALAADHARSESGG